MRVSSFDLRVNSKIQMITSKKKPIIGNPGLEAAISLELISLDLRVPTVEYFRTIRLTSTEKLSRSYQAFFCRFQPKGGQNSSGFKVRELLGFDYSS